MKKGITKLDDEDDDNNSSNGSKNERRLKRRQPSTSMTENTNCTKEYTKDTKITSEMSIIEEVRKLHEAYQFILCEHQRKLEVKKRRETSYAKSSAQ